MGSLSDVIIIFSSSSYVFATSVRAALQVQIRSMLTGLCLYAKSPLLCMDIAKLGVDTLFLGQEREGIQ